MPTVFFSTPTRASVPTIIIGLAHCTGLPNLGPRVHHSVQVFSQLFNSSSLPTIVYRMSFGCPSRDLRAHHSGFIFPLPTIVVPLFDCPVGWFRFPNPGFYFATSCLPKLGAGVTTRLNFYLKYGRLAGFNNPRSQRSGVYSNKHRKLDGVFIRYNLTIQILR